MNPITRVDACAVALRRSDVDTDQIVPARFLKRITRTGFADALFAGWRSNPDFELNAPTAAGARILVAGERFGTGSSREHAVWALRDGGFDVVIAASFGDIFRGNAGKGGLVAIDLPIDQIEQLWSAIDDDPTGSISVDLETCSISWGSGRAAFSMDGYTRWRLMEGLDDIGLTLRHRDDITAFEARRPRWLPTTPPASSVSG